MILSLTWLSWSNGKIAVGEAEKRRRDSGSSPELSKAFFWGIFGSSEGRNNLCNAQYNLDNGQD